MKIAQQFPQFKKERALLIVTGTQEAEFYLAGDGVIEKIEMFRVPKIKFSDREGLSVRTGKTGVTGGSSNSPKELYQQAFVAKFKVTAKDVVTRVLPTQITIISPVIAEIEQLLPVTAKKLVTMRLKKNVCERHMEEILGHVQKELSK
ncbi:MAG: hypothetical protein ACD_81C00180G0005 [uncultured bacterium]|uniref:Uncharacterized protein n=2 Tax=Candidatus Wolfeibacteriota TaxID=1752735 RepID=A0A0G1HAR7_9BACT|nr:MAG: hypothetical protein ACD_81C00180G0005 [uncultured bacterium]KKR12957.1 MAG: hypothetical protein UT41_C0001G0501 [Candidatus Wolfebacteria bacterium GW2011_GWC2_39_22]KKT43885.1 MAG: hypothetical protein UW32_C0001G0477 [Candidatus Wolfebacteria bacterium GW2011_GWE2_44_13]HBI25388.1 hypothetical protein [Candidatus Wolfebacteria bacterium]